MKVRNFFNNSRENFLNTAKPSIKEHSEMIEGTQKKTIYDCLFLYKNLKKQWNVIRKRTNPLSKGISGISIYEYGKNINENLLNLEKKILQRKWSPSPYYGFTLKKAGKEKPRPILAPDIEDRIIQKILAEYFLEVFSDKIRNKASYGCIPKKNKKKDSVSSIESAMNRISQIYNEKKYFIFESDIENFFPSIDREKLLKIISSKITDESILNLLQKFIEYEIGNLEAIPALKKFPDLFSVDNGIAQGCVFSPLLANLYLFDFDNYFIQNKAVYLIRYVDDFVILCPTEEIRDKIEIQAKEQINKLNLKLSTEKTFKKNIEKESFEFLGLIFNKGEIKVHKGKIKKFKENLKSAFNSQSFKKYIVDRRTGKKTIERTIKKDVLKSLKSKQLEWMKNKIFDDRDSLLLRNINEKFVGWYAYYRNFLTEKQKRDILNSLCKFYRDYLSKKYKRRKDLFPKKEFFSIEHYFSKKRK